MEDKDFSLCQYDDRYNAIRYTKRALMRRLSRKRGIISVNEHLVVIQASFGYTAGQCHYVDSHTVSINGDLIRGLFCVPNRNELVIILLGIRH